MDQSAGQNEINEKFMLFYSNRCGQSKKFIELLQEYPHINSCFQKLEVEMLHKMGRLPPQLTHTPGVIDGNQLLMGPNAFEWLKEKSNKLVGSGPSINPKGGFNGIGFSFIGESESDFSPVHANFGRENQNNGSSIDPNTFDPKSGEPINGQSATTYNPNPNDFNSSNSSVNRELPPQLQPQSVGNGGNSTNFSVSGYQQQGNFQGSTNNGLPPQLQPQQVDSGNGKMTDSDMQRYMANRDHGINIQV